MHPKSTQNVVAMSYYSGQIGDPSGAIPNQKILHVCLDHLESGESVAVLRTSSALAGVIERAALCVDGTIVMNARECTPEAYIAAWRDVQASGDQATLLAWLLGHDVTTTMTLPRAGAAHQPWLSPLYHQATARLFGAQATGTCVAQLTSVEDIRSAVHVIQGLAAYGMTTQSLSQTLQVHQHHNALRAVA